MTMLDWSQSDFASALPIPAPAMPAAEQADATDLGSIERGGARVSIDDKAMTTPAPTSTSFCR